MAQDGSPRRLSPLWHHMRTMALAPPPMRPKGEEYLPPREITDEDLEPLRTELDWRPTVVLKKFGPVRTEEEYLPRLIVACAVLQGVHRIQDLTERLISLNGVNLPRIQQMIGNDALASRKGELKDLRRRVNSARDELVATRARSANDLDTELLHPDGLRQLDLLILTEQAATTILAYEVVRRRNVAGIDYGLAVARRMPPQEYAEEWCERALGTAKMRGLLLFTPREYGRVIVVYEDGRLAYDPGVPEAGQ